MVFRILLQLYSFIVSNWNIYETKGVRLQGALISSVSTRVLLKDITDWQLEKILTGISSSWEKW